MNKYLNINSMDLPGDLKKLSLRQCKYLCDEIRKILIDTVSKTGGHLSSNLGTVELTLAIHRIFNCPEDKIIWDVGHQSYTHKILTGRLKDFDTLRQENGISGFPKPKESIYDSFISGHSSTSISAACGIAKGMRLSGKDNSTVAVIGDGAFTGGMAYEGLNNAGKSKENIIIILNHNDMSISKNVGAFAKYLSTIRNNPEYLNTKNIVEGILDNTPVIGKPAKTIIRASKSALKSVLYHSTMFEDFGFVYLGPVDGHNQEELEKTLLVAKQLKKPVFVHVNTVKGKGFSPAEKNPGAFHGLSKYELQMGNPEVISEDSFSAVFGKELNRLATKDKRICAVTAAMKYGTGLQYFHNTHPKRFFDVGIAEQHAVTFGAGLSKSGMIPVVAVYSTFLQRAYDQILHDCSIDNTHIVLAIDRAGVVGEDGETHQGIFDVSFLTSIPNITIMSPFNYEELKQCLYKAIYDIDGVVAVRYPKGNDLSSFAKSSTDYVYINNSSDTLVITYGRIFNNLYKAYDKLKSNDKCIDMLKLTTIFPLDKKIIEIVSKYKRVIIFEESIKCGGIAEHLSSMLLENKFKGNVYLHCIEQFVKQATVDNSLNNLGLSTDKIYSSILEVLNDD